MKLAYLVGAPGIPVQGPSGASAHVRGIVRALRKKHDVTCVAALREDRRGAFGEPVDCLEGGVPGWPSWLRRWREVREIRAGRRVARLTWERGEGVEGIIERHSLFSDAGWRAAKRLDVPWLLEVNAPPVLERERFEEILQRGWAERWQGEVLRAAPVVCAVSRWLVSWLRDEIGCGHVVRVPNGIEPHVGDRARGRDLLGLGDERVVGFVGSVKPWHGAERVVAVAAALGGVPVVVGANAVEGAHQVGHLSGQQLADVVAAFDVGLAPYPADAPPWFCPLKILEYRAQGVPVVATDVADCAELVGEGGIVVEAGDDAALVEATRAALERRCEPWVRSWGDVAEELIGALAPRL